MKIRPLQDRIIVERIDEEETSKGGIIIPDTAKEKSQEGKVVAVGKGKILENGKIPIGTCSEEQHAKRRRARNAYCVDCGRGLFQAR